MSIEAKAYYLEEGWHSISATENIGHRPIMKDIKHLEYHVHLWEHVCNEVSNSFSVQHYSE